MGLAYLRPKPKGSLDYSRPPRQGPLRTAPLACRGDSPQHVVSSVIYKSSRNGNKRAPEPKGSRRAMG